MISTIDFIFMALSVIIVSTIVAVVANRREIKHWIGHIQPPDWLNALAMVVALGVIPMIIYYGRWILGGALLILIIVNLH